MTQQSLQQIIMERLGIERCSDNTSVAQLVVDNRYTITLDFIDNQLTILACILPLPEGLAEQSLCFQRVATACLNLAPICREQVYLASDRYLMLRCLVSQAELTLPKFDELLQDFLNTLAYLVEITQKL